MILIEILAKASADGVMNIAAQKTLKHGDRSSSGMVSRCLPRPCRAENIRHPYAAVVTI